MVFGGGGGCRVRTFKLLMLSSNLLKSQIPYMAGGGGGGRVQTFKLLMLSPNLLKSQIPYTGGGGGRGEGGLKAPTFSHFKC